MSTKERKSVAPIKLPDGWRSTRMSGSFIQDSLVPLLLAALGLFTGALIVFIVGIMVGIIPWT